MKDRRTFLINSVLGAATVGLSSIKSLSNSTDKKQEILCNPTTLDYYGEGPFYIDNPPLIEENKLAGPNDAGQKIVIAGRVLNLDCNQFIPDTVVDVWHANDAGQYDNLGYNFRGQTVSNDQGFYLFETILPGKYLNGNSFRPSHIHFKITAPGFTTLTTQLYFAGDDSIPGDAAASITSGTYDATDRIISLTEDSDGVLQGTFDVVVNGEGIAVGTADLHIDKGMLYKVNPNPFKNRLEIEYGIFNKAKVGLVVYDLLGREVATLEDSVLSADKYVSVWEPDSTLSVGHYFVALRINDLQVHYLKIVKV